MTKPARPSGRQVVDEVLDPGVVRVRVGRLAVRPAGVLRDRGGAPLLHVERRVRHDEVGAGAGELVVEQRVAELDVAREAVDREVHPADPPGRLVVLLAEDRDLARRGRRAPRRTRPTGRTARPSRRRGRGRGPRRARASRRGAASTERGRVELAAAVALLAGELPDEVLVGAPEDVAGALGVVAEADLRDRRRRARRASPAGSARGRRSSGGRREAARRCRARSRRAPRRSARRCRAARRRRGATASAPPRAPRRRSRRCTRRGPRGSRRARRRPR